MITEGAECQRSRRNGDAGAWGTDRQPDVAVHAGEQGIVGVAHACLEADVAGRGIDACRKCADPPREAPARIGVDREVDFLPRRKLTEMALRQREVEQQRVVTLQVDDRRARGHVLSEAHLADAEATSKGCRDGQLLQCGAVALQRRTCRVVICLRELQVRLADRPPGEELTCPRECQLRIFQSCFVCLQVRKLAGIIELDQQITRLDRCTGSKCHPGDVAGDLRRDLRARDRLEAADDADLAAPGDFAGAHRRDGDARCALCCGSLCRLLIDVVLAAEDRAEKHGERDRCDYRLRAQRQSPPCWSTVVRVLARCWQDRTSVRTKATSQGARDVVMHARMAQVRRTGVRGHGDRSESS